MQLSLQIELLKHVINTIEDQNLYEFDELHQRAFNEDYYVVGYYEGEQWLKHHGISPFEAISECVAWSLEAFGEVQLQLEDINGEVISNIYAYIMGEHLLADYNLEQSREDLVADLLTDLKRYKQYESTFQKPVSNSN